jgi:hypothetical protein
MKPSTIRTWAVDVGLTDRGVARLLGVSPHTVISWRKADRAAREPLDWRDRIIAGLEREIERLRCLRELGKVSRRTTALVVGRPRN